MPTNSVNSPIVYNSTWNEQNNQFKPRSSPDSILNKLLFLPSAIAANAILPVIGKVCGREDGQPISILNNELLQRNFTETPLEITNPDGVKIGGTYLKNRNASENSPTVIFFNSNGTLSKLGAYNWLVEQAAIQDFSYNFIYFDYRGTGDSIHSTIPLNQKPLFLDADSVYNFVKNKLHVPPKDIHFYGWSLGGGISAAVKAAHPECDSRYVNERSFTCLGDVTTNILSSFKSWIVSKLLSFLNWNMDSVSAFEKIKGKSLIVHHPEDQLMKGKASLYATLFQKNLPQVTGLDLSRSTQNPENKHVAPFGMFKTDNFDPAGEIAKFVFDSNCSYEERLKQRFEVAPVNFRNHVFAKIATMYQNGGGYWRSAEDAYYNRNGQSLTDKQRAEAIVQVKAFG